MIGELNDTEREIAELTTTLTDMFRQLTQVDKDYKYKWNDLAKQESLENEIAACRQEYTKLKQDFGHGGASSGKAHIL